MANQKLYFTAAEPSGDLFASEVIDALRGDTAPLTFRATGGRELAARCEASFIDTSPLNVLGLWEGVKAYRDVSRISSQIADDIIAFDPDAVVLVDAWGLSLRIAQKVRAAKRDIKLIKLIGPQVWASRAGRAKTLAARVDHLLCMHAFEEPYYAPYGLKTTIIGQPALARSERLDPSIFRLRHAIDVDEDLLLILPGSRPAEIQRVAPPLVEATKSLSESRPDMKVCIAPASAVFSQFRKAYPELPEDWIILSDEGQRYEAMAAATLALSCSGTVNTELAVQRTPFITGYKIGAISWALLKAFLLKAEYITLLNMAAGKMIAPELLQNAFTGKALAAKASALLDAPDALERQRLAQDRALENMGYGGTPAAMLAAKAILADLQV